MTCACHQTHMPPLRGLGAIVMQPLKGGLAQGGAVELIAAGGALAPFAAMAGAAVSYGAVAGVASRNWKTAGTGAILGAGLTGTLAGLTTITAGSAMPEARALLLPGALYTIAGAGLLVWGGMRSSKRRRR